MVNNGFKIWWLKVFFIITILSLVLAETCPGLSGWDIRARTVCEDEPRKYHCLENQAGEIKEVCITPIYINKGHYPVLSIGEDALLERSCPRTHYQPNGQLSNKYQKVPCTYTKDVCEDDGEETCDDGDTTRDRMCRCDYTRGYVSIEYLLKNPRLKSCYRPKSEVQGCVMMPCKNETELNKAYQCVSICPSGYFRPKFEFDCVPRQITSSPSTSTELMTTKADDARSQLMTTMADDGQSRQKEVPEMTDQVMEYTIPILFACISAMFVALVVLIYLSWKGINRMKCKSGDYGNQESFHLSGEGEKLRKYDDEGLLYKEGDIIHENKLKYSIGCITVKSVAGKEFGTGFRVGERHVMTAYHVVQGVFENLWKTVISRLKQRRDDEHIKDILSEFGSNSNPGDGKWNLTDLLKPLDSKTQENFKSIGKKMVSDACKITFGYIDDKNGSPFTFSYDAPFISTKHDVAILELLTEESNDSMPDPLSLADLCTPAEYLHILGHPDGGKLIIDHKCQILSDESLKSTIKKGIKLFTSLGEKRSEVEDEYSECKHSQNHIFFHCSKSTAHGASGSPLIEITKEEVPEVIGILLKGYPKVYYNKYFQNKKVDKHPAALIESGVSMEMVKNLLHEHNLVDLAEVLFR